MRCLPKTEKTRSTPRHSVGRGLGEGGVVTGGKVVAIVDTEAVSVFMFIFVDVAVVGDTNEGGGGGDVVFVEKGDDDKDDDDCDENDVFGNAVGNVVVCNDGVE